MKRYAKPSFGRREQITHRVLFYLQRRTSSRAQEWRNVTLKFFYELFEYMESEPSLNAIVHRADGMHIYSGPQKVAFLHFTQRHFLVQAPNKSFLIWKDGSRLFKDKHEGGAFPRMWKAKTEDEVGDFLNYLRKLPKYPVSVGEKRSRTIPSWVKTFVWDRDGGKCVNCDSRDGIHFDHILPFSRGGSSLLPVNIQLLCEKCNLSKSASLRN